MNRQRTRWLSFLLAVIMVLAMLPPVPLTVRAAENSLEGKTISILGASISTYAGTSNGTAADTTNSTIRSNAKYYPSSVVTDVTLADTWWMQAAEDLGLRLLVNNSWSGSSLLHTRNGTVGAYVDRCVQLHDDTGDNAGEEPDIIAIQMGTNDFQYYKDTLGTADIDYDALIAENSDGTYTYAEPVTSLEAAAIVLHKISVRYPGAEVYYLNISQRVDGTDELIRSFNTELQQVVEHFGAHIVDIYGSAITMDSFPTYIGDGRVHPNKLGMDAYTEAFKRSLLANTAYAVDTHTVSMELDGVTADYGDDKIVVDGDGFTTKLTAPDDLRVTVTMGSKDITKSAYAEGVVTIDAVTDDVTITASSVFEPHTYRWEFDGTDLACVSGGNALTKNGGTTTDGVFSGTRYALQTEVVLRHDQPWAVEWKSEGTWRNSASSSGGRLFSESDVNADYNVRYIFKSAVNGLLAMGEKTASGSHNYGVALSDYGIDGDALHTYRLENRIAADGSNMVWLYVDGKEIGPMNHYYIGTKDQKSTSDWLSGKDFVFPYIGTDTHGLTNCSIEYIQVWEEFKNTSSISMRYDDHLDMAGKLVEIIDAGTPTSYQVGYGVEENTVRDTAVVTLEDDTLVATGIGRAAVMIDGEAYEITVTAAPISLLLLIGQSNMQGSEGNADQSIVCPDGMVYATYGDRYTMTTANATNFAPSALTGEGSVWNVNGTTANLEDWPVYLLNEAGAGKAGPDSGYAYEWVKQTGEKVWIVNAAHGGTSISVWQKGTTQYEECLALFSACQETLRKEIAAGHFTLSHTGYFWCQGCSDETKTAEWYVNQFLSMHEALNQDLSMDIDGDGKVDPLEFANITVTLAGHVKKTGYRYDDSLYDAADSTFFMTYEELEMRGQRVAQYWLAGNPDYPEINMVCNIGESWVKMPDGTDGVAEYFAAHYENGTVNYTTQAAQKSSWYKPATASAVKDSIHYNQIGYNEIGIEAARNTLILLGEVPDSTAETTVRFVDWTGYREVCAISASTEGNSGTLVVPIVYPCYRSKSVNYQVSDGLHYSYYDLLTNSEETTGTLTAIGASGCVDVELGHNWSAWETVCEPSVDGPGIQQRVCSDCGETETKEINGVWQTLKLSEHMAAMPSEYCCATNLWTAMEHDKYFFNGTSSWNIHTSGTVYSVTIPVSAGDQIFATSFGAAGENGGTKDGIRLTFFNADGVAKTFAPADTYAEFMKNGGCLIAPEGAVAANIAMWTNSDDNELYILNRDHCYANGSCTVCGTAHPNLANYQGKVISILGGSNCTFAGYIPVADGFNLEHRSRYPDASRIPDVTDVSQTWWMQLLTQLDAKLGINDSWAGSQVLNTMDGNSGDLGEDAAMASLTRIQNLGANGTPDAILFFGGCNDIGRSVKLGSFDPATAPKEADLTATKWETFADAYVAAITRMQHFYPDTQILVMLPYNSPTYFTASKVETYGGVIRAICDHYGVAYVDLRDSGIDSSHLPDNIHPNAAGCDLITAAVLDALLGEIELEAGAHTVYPVTHKLTNAGASLHYYKGISAWKPFRETISGDSVTVTVTMGGADITDKAYADGVISISSVTGDLVITAKGAFNADGRLQPLPENICGGTNLWPLLEHQNEYYTADGWGNNSNSNYSVTIPVTPGDRIWASSFGTAGANGYSANAVRITWFSEEGVLESVDRDAVYAEFKANGCVTAPEGAAAVNIPMASDDASWELYILNLEHPYNSVVTDPTCTDGGFTTHTCPLCDDSFLDSWVDATGHQYGEWKATTAPTCTEAGEERRDCDNCNHCETRPVAAKGHDYESVVTPPTCTEKGYTTHSCSVCGDSYVDSYTDELGHYHATAETLADGESLVLTDLNVVKHNKTLIFSGEVDELGDGLIRISHGKDSYAGTHLEITSDKLTVYSTSGSVSVKAYTHGLTIEGTVHIRIHAGRSGATITITTDSGTFSQFGGWSGCNGEIACEAEGVTLRNVDLRWYALGIESDYWFFGDSWFSTTGNAGWTKHMLDDGYTDVLLGAYGGMGAAVGLQQFRELVQINAPQYAVWALGMNNGDKNGAINNSWLSCTEEFLALCEEYGVTPILCTIPTTPKVNNRLKNAWIKESGYRYIDFDLALVENHITGEWFEGTAAADLNHPTELGAKLLYPQVFADFPELAKADPADCSHSMHLLGKRDAECECGGREAYYVCPLCGGHYLDEAGTVSTSTAQMLTEPLGHDYSHEITPPTCTEQGYTTHTCTQCGNSYIDNYVDAPGHRYGQWQVITAPTCTETGDERRDCENCEHYETRPVASTGHDYESVVIPPTCTERGYTTHTCHCGDSYVDTYVEALGHRYGEWMVTIAPICTETGEERRDCENCNHYETRSIAAKGHDYESVVTPPTCTEKGYTTHTCHCGDSYVDSYVEALGHRYGDWKVTTAATCTEAGKERRDCENCGHYETRPVAAKGHDYESVVIPPTCTEQGYTTHTCHCGDSYVDTYVEATGHSWGDWEVVKEPSVTDPGKQRRVCVHCGETEQEEIPRLEISYGDVNGDGKINTLDLILLRKFLNGGDVETNEEAIDCSGDGKVNTLDLILLRKFLNGDDVTLGPWAD